MTYIQSDRIGIDSENRTVTIDYITMPLPNKIKGNNVAIVNNELYVDGYEYRKGKWKRTLRALWHCYGW